MEAKALNFLLLLPLQKTMRLEVALDVVEKKKRFGTFNAKKVTSTASEEREVPSFVES